MSVHLTFYGHACFALHADGVRLLLDPYEPGSLNGAVQLPALPDHFDAVACTHGHVDHAAVHTVPSAQVLDGDARFGPFTLERYTAHHDEHGGRLRGGSTDLIRIRVHQTCIVHAGDLGERPTGRLLDWLRREPIDALIVPVGGYYTIGPNAARELVRLVAPRRVIPCHSAADGVCLPALAPRDAFLEGQPHTTVQALTLPATETTGAEQLGEVVVIQRQALA